MTTIYVDGACKGNHLPGKLRSAGAGVYVDRERDSAPRALPVSKKDAANCDPLLQPNAPLSRFAWRSLPSLAQQEASGQSGVPVTNNRAELIATLMALEIVQKFGARLDAPITIVTDSELLFNAVTKWLPGWRRNNFCKRDGKPVANQLLVRALDELLEATRSYAIAWRHMNSHRREPENRASAAWRAWHGNGAADRLANWACTKALSTATVRGAPRHRSRVAAPGRRAPVGARKRKPRTSLRRILSRLKL